MFHEEAPLHTLQATTKCQHLLLTTAQTEELHVQGALSTLPRMDNGASVAETSIIRFERPPRRELRDACIISSQGSQWAPSTLPSDFLVKPRVAMVLRSIHSRSLLSSTEQRQASSTFQTKPGASCPVHGNPPAQPLLRAMTK